MRRGNLLPDLRRSVGAGWPLTEDGAASPAIGQLWLCVGGVALSDQLKSLDWRERRAKRIARLPAEVMEEAVGKILALVDPAGEAP